MYNRDSRIETKVGLFILTGFLVVAFLVVYFGRLGQGLQQFYNLQVDFPNASGLLAGADVLLGGARIGYVKKNPQVLPAMQGVAVELDIREEIILPVASTFVIGSSGLLGNRFVDVLVEPGADLEARLAPGSVIVGKRETGFEDLTRDSTEMLADIRQAIATINLTLERLDSTALSQESLEDIRQTIANIKEGSEGLSSLKQTTADLEIAAAEARKILSSVRTGSGPLPMLLNDKQTANEMRALLANLRRHGILWYKDSYQDAPSP